MNDNDYKPPITITNTIPTPVERAIAHLKELSEEDRLDVFQAFCEYCGRVLTDHWDKCSCWNDE